MNCGESEVLTDSLLSDPLFGALLVLVFFAKRFLRGRMRSGVTKHAFTLEVLQLKVKWKRKSKRR